MVMEKKELVPLPEKEETITIPDLAQKALASGRGAEEMAIAERVVELQFKWEKNEAKKAYAADFAEMDFPPIYKTAKGLNSSYPPWHETLRTIKPILRAHGFALSFTSAKPDEKDRIPIYATLTHKLGHSETGEIWQPIGQVSRGMNANQAIASATTYGQRYAAANLLNLEFVDMDDDAQSFSLITPVQREKIEELITECKLTPLARSKFLDVMKVKAVADITFENYSAAIDLLNRKLQKVKAEAQK